MSIHNIPFSISKENHPIFFCSYIWVFSIGLKNEFETAVVSEPSWFEPLKFFCTCIQVYRYNLKGITLGVAPYEILMVFRCHQ